MLDKYESKLDELKSEQGKAERSLNPFVAAGHAKVASRLAIELIEFMFNELFDGGRKNG